MNNQITKYRLLTNEELELLKPEFIQYLASNGIDAEKWESILKSEEKERDFHLSAFSNLVLQKSLEKIKYLDFISANDIRLFYFAQEEAFLITLKSDKIDLSKTNSITSEQIKDIDFFTADKKYSSTREEEIFEWLSKGCSISKGELFYQFKKVIEANINTP